jgi:hypothetical protein
MTEEQFLDLIRENRHLGFGRMIQIISYDWEESGPGAGLIHTNGVNLRQKDRVRFYTLRAGDPLREYAGWTAKDERERRALGMTR